ncbi:hypothetical protein [Corynebacterium sp. A21]|uniref:hypothetical protein n=1 Tax=Corynebacterium sp. A21 TaxID=3457318 RepID=UPI003FD02B1B
MTETYHQPHDAEQIRFFDVAHEGAQVRSAAGVVSSGQLDQLHLMQPRSVVVVATDQVSRVAAQAVGTLRCPLRHPFLVTASLPNFFGALDVLVVVGDGNSVEAHRALAAADARGAVSILVGAAGPVAEEAPRGTVKFPVLPTALGPSPARTIAAVATVLDLLEEDPDLIVQRLLTTADVLDAEAENLSPERDLSINPGRQLREHVEGARILHTGNQAIAEVVAALWTVKGLPATAVDVAELPGALADAPAPEADLFHDPFLDEPTRVIPLKVVVWAADLQGIPAASVQNCTEETPGPLAEALALITRGYAATTYLNGREDF